MNRRDFLLGMTGVFIGATIPFNLEPKKRIYLTIDDCPRKHMGDIIDVLGENKATFFCVGQYLEEKKEVALKALEQGHLIGNHSYNHANFSRLSFEKAKKNILKTDEQINKLYKEAGVNNPRLFRFPYGIRGSKKTTSKLDEFFISEGIREVGWDLDIEDYRYISKSKPANLEYILNLAKRASDGNIVLCHDLEITAKYVIPYYVYSGKYELLLL